MLENKKFACIFMYFIHEDVSVKGRRFVMEKCSCCEVLEDEEGGRRLRESELQVALCTPGAQGTLKQCGTKGEAKEDFLWPLDTMRISESFLRGCLPFPRLWSISVSYHVCFQKCSKNALYTYSSFSPSSDVLQPAHTDS